MDVRVSHYDYIWLVFSKGWRKERLPRSRQRGGHMMIERENLRLFRNTFSGVWSNAMVALQTKLKLANALLASYNKSFFLPFFSSLLVINAGQDVDFITNTWRCLLCYSCKCGLFELTARKRERERDLTKRVELTRDSNNANSSISSITDIREKASFRLDQVEAKRDY